MHTGRHTSITPFQEPLNVLFVDDDEEEFHWVRKLLTRHAGLKLEWARGCEDAYAALGQHAYDVLLVDFLLHGDDGCNGFDVVQVARERSPAMPCIVVTGMQRRDMDLESLACGAADYLDKADISAQTLTRTIRRALERKKHEVRQLQAHHMLALTQRATAAVNAAQTVPDALQGCLREVCSTLGFRVANALAIDKDVGYATTLLSHLGDAKADEPLLPLLQARVLPLHDGVVAHLAARRDIDFCADLADSADPDGAALVAHGLRSVLHVPIVSTNGLYAVIELFSDEPRVPEPGALQVLRAIASQMELAVAREHAEQERRHVEDQLFRSQKTDVVAGLAAGAAHDFNNLLTVILGQVEQLLETPLDEGPAQALTSVRDAAVRGADLTRQLLAVGRRSTLTATRTDANELLRESEALLRRILPEDIQLAFDLAPKLGAVKVERGAFEQVLLNLVLNARDAIEGRGKLTLRTRDVQVASGGRRRAGKYICISVTDTGKGMAPDVVGRVFEPFFTTKGAAGGSGLGLPSAFGIVMRAGGYIDVQSTVGEGTTFEVLLPSHDHQPVSEPAPSLSEVRGGAETIMLLEDDEEVRNVAARALRTHGYTVLESVNAQSALYIARRERHIDLLLSDIVMPDMNGPELAAAILELHPAASVLFMSGHSERLPETWGSPRLPTTHAFIRKPFSPRTLAMRVHAVLETRERPS